MKLVRLFTAGNVDDGKSTLIGRLLLDSGAVSTDIIHGLTKSKGQGYEEGVIDLAFLTDGLRSERALGITIDVAYKYFSTQKNKYIIADTPGHWEYTRNMFTGASLCHVAIILIDVTIGITEQTKRHALIVSLLGVNQVVFAINKMDLKHYAEAVFDAIKIDLITLSEELKINTSTILPMSALKGDNVVKKSTFLSWFNGPTLFDYLENSICHNEHENKLMRFQVQYPIHANDSIGYAGRIEHGIFRVGQKVLVGSTGQQKCIQNIVHNTQSVPFAEEGMCVSFYFDNQTELKRGDVFSAIALAPTVGNRFTSNLCWMSDKSSDPETHYLLQIGAISVRAKISAIQQKLLENNNVSENLLLNDIARVVIETETKIVFDRYEEAKASGSFILIDPSNYATIAAGIIS
jgi:sulfate adenylyltransferase subunit 1